MQKEKEDITTTALNKQIDLMDQMREKSNLGQFVTDAMLRDVKRITDEGIKNGRSWTKHMMMSSLTLTTTMGPEVKSIRISGEVYRAI